MAAVQRRVLSKTFWKLHLQDSFAAGPFARALAGLALLLLANRVARQRRLAIAEVFGDAPGLDLGRLALDLGRLALLEGVPSNRLVEELVVGEAVSN